MLILEEEEFSDDESMADKHEGMYLYYMICVCI